MNEDNLNMEIRKFLKKVGITSQRIIEKKLNEAFAEKKIDIGQEIDLEMNLSIKSINSVDKILGKIKID